jgi:2Fe-2S ferredoxin
MKVEFTPLSKTAEVRADETILDAARRVGAPIGNSCGGIGICARCRVCVVTGAEQLTPPTVIESRMAAERGLSANERLACQAVVLGDCAITTSYW